MKTECQNPPKEPFYNTGFLPFTGASSSGSVQAVSTGGSYASRQGPDAVDAGSATSVLP